MSGGMTFAAEQMGVCIRIVSKRAPLLCGNPERAFQIHSVLASLGKLYDTLRYIDPNRTDERNMKFYDDRRATSTHVIGETFISDIAIVNDFKCRQFDNNNFWEMVMLIAQTYVTDDDDDVESYEDAMRDRSFVFNALGIVLLNFKGNAVDAAYNMITAAFFENTATNISD